MTNELTVVVPVYGVEEYLAKCLDSLLCQSVDNYQILVINDGSKDNSQSIIDEYQNKYPNKVKGYIKENGGLSDARNYGLKYVGTPYVMFIDADDYVEKDMVETCLKAIKQDLDIVVFSYYQHYVANNSFEVINLKIKEGIYNPKENPEIIAYTPNAAWNKIYKTSLFKENNIIYPKGLLYEDLGTTPILLAKSLKVGYINKALYHYLVDRPNNITKQVDKRIFDVIKIMENNVKYFKDNNLYETYNQELHYLYKINTIENMRKAMKSKDKKLTIDYIEKVFDVEKKLFDSSILKYNIELNGSDIIYKNKSLAKMYYRFKSK